MTLGGAELRVVEACVVSLAGADLGAERDDGHVLAAGAVHRLPAGARVRFGGSRTGLRAYLGLAGGIAARHVLGSAATYAGGQPRRRRRARAARRRPPRATAARRPRRRRTDVAVRDGAAPGDAATARSGSCRVPTSTPAAGTRRSRSPAADVDGRPAERPDGDPPRRARPRAGAPRSSRTRSSRVPSRSRGDGRPIVLLVDGPTIGGYPVIGVVSRADLPRLGQLRPGDAVRLARQDADAARAAWHEQRRAMAMVAAALHADALWLRLLENAGG